MDYRYCYSPPTDVDMYGFEAQVIYQLNDALKVTTFSDVIRAKQTRGGNLPRIPPMRLGTKFNYEADKYSAELSITHHFEQDKTAATETRTASYTMLDMNFNYYLNTDSFAGDLIVYFKGQNLTDEHARVHASFLKNVVPLPGRGFSLGLRGGF